LRLKRQELQIRPHLASGCVRARPAPDDASSIVAWNLPPHLFAAVAQSRPRQRDGCAHCLQFTSVSCLCGPIV